MMFCSECGTKAIDGAVFCQKCGAKLVQDDREAQESVSVQESVEIPIPSVGTISESEHKSVKEKEPEKAPMDERAEQTAVPVGGSRKPKSQEEIFAILEADTAMCHGVKSAKIMGNGLMVRGRSHVHFMNIMNGTAKLRSTLSAPFSLINWILYLLIGWLGATSFRMGWDESEHGYIYFEDYALPFVLFPIIAGLFIALMPYIGYKEKASVRECVRKAVESEGISLATNEMKPVIRFVISAILVLIGVMVFIFGVLDVEFGGRDSGSAAVYSGEDSDGSYDLDSNESVLLTQTYVNEDEGFSFMYPYDWEIEDVEEVNPDALVSVACTGMLGTYARISVVKEIDDGSYFAATESDFEEAYSSLEVFSDVNVMDLSDTILGGCPARKLTMSAKNNIGVYCVLVQYFYIQDYYVYTVMFAVERDNYDSYEPKFDAIMDSYTIAAVDTSSEMVNDSIFGEALVQLIMYNMLPDGSIANDLDGKIDGMYDQFAICDIDQDGEKELLVNILSGSMSAAGMYIYGVNAARTGLEYVGSFYTDATFYDTGCVKAAWPHNQGLANNFWPYSIYQRTNEGYSEIGSADAWEKTYMEFDFNRNPFPDEVDLNGNGIIYFISGENGIDYDNPVDDAEYKEFEKRFFGSADDLYVPWQSLELHNIKAATGIEYEGDGYGGNGVQDDASQDLDDFWGEAELSDFSYENLFLYSGSYGGINQTSIYVNIYSSFDEGNTVGNVFLYDSSGYETFVLIRDDNEGEGIYTLCLDDFTTMYIRFYQDSYGEYYADIQGLDAIYTNVNPVETYVMTEQYIP